MTLRYISRDLSHGGKIYRKEVKMSVNIVFLPALLDCYAISL